MAEQVIRLRPPVTYLLTNGIPAAGAGYDVSRQDVRPVRPMREACHVPEHMATTAFGTLSNLNYVTA